MAAKVFEDFKPIFGEAMAEREPGSVAAPSSLHGPFLFYVHALDPYRLEIVATDFCSHTLERVLTVQDVEDLRDETGVGSSCSEFVDYLVASLSSDDAKVVVGGATKLVAHKAKGMPRISLSFNKPVGSSANDLMANLSLALYRAFREQHGEVVKEHMRILQLEKLLYFEKEKSECLQRQLDSHSFKRKISQPKSSDKGHKAATVSDRFSNTDSILNSEAQQSSGSKVCCPLASIQCHAPNAETPTGKDSPTVKASLRVLPAHRRSKVRGALLQDTENDDN